MKKLILIILIGSVAWSYYAKKGGSFDTFSNTDRENELTLDTNNSSNYQCDGREHCSQMSSYEEAVYFIENCPNTKMDGDRDGVPCERQFDR